MTIARSRLVDVSVTRWYHAISRVVRRASLLAEGASSATGDRKQWIENRLQFLDSLFAISVAGFAILDNHLHCLIRLDPDIAKAWSPQEVALRWFKLYPPKGSDRKALSAKKFKELLAERAGDPPWVEKTRERLSSLSWYMKNLKEPLSRLVNKAEGCTGAFFEGRFKSIAVLDEEALFSVCAYIDLNPLAAGMAKTPEESQHTSVKARVDHVKAQGRMDDLKAALQGSVAGSRASFKLEEALWLIPIEDRRRQDAGHPGVGTLREGMLEGMTFGNYLMLVEYTGRKLRSGKASISSDLADVFVRMGSTPETWGARMAQLATGKFYGRAISSDREQLRTVAKQLGVQRLACVAAAGAR